MPGARAGHVAVRAGSFILIWGGYDEPPQPVCPYNPNVTLHE